MSDFKHTPEPWGLRKLFDDPILVESDQGEKFYINCFSVIDAKGRVIADVQYQTDTKIMGWGHNETIAKWKANATRIVACVNACAGKPNPERWVKEAESMLQKIYDFEHPELKLGESKLEFILKLAAERDRLLFDIKLLLKYLQGNASEPYPDFNAIEHLNKSIQAIKGGQP